MFSLNTSEKTLFEELKNRHEEISKEYKKTIPLFVSEEGMEQWRKKILEAAPLAYQLYMSLKKRDIKVTYNRYLVKNRLRSTKCHPIKKEFHDDDHAIEGLVNFINKNIRKENSHGSS